MGILLYLLIGHVVAIIVVSVTWETSNEHAPCFCMTVVFWPLILFVFCLYAWGSLMAGLCGGVAGSKG